jgi:hypothetical protein
MMLTRHTSKLWIWIIVQGHGMLFFTQLNQKSLQKEKGHIQYKKAQEKSDESLKIVKLVTKVHQLRKLVVPSYIPSISRT